MTKSQNITILGGGIMGLMTAYMLADTRKIKLHDPKGFPADNASLMAGGMLAPYSEIEHLDDRWIDAGLKGIKIWKDIPLEMGFEANGSLLIAHAQDHYILERFKSHLPKKIQTYQNVQDIEEQLSQHHKTGLFLEEEAHLDPNKTMRALCEYLDNHPNIELSQNTPSKTENLTIDCRGMAESDAELRGVKGEIAIVHNTDFSLNRPVRLMHPRYPLYVIPRENNVFMIGATVIESAENNTVNLRSAMELLSALYSLHPSFADAQILEIKAGIRPSYPDNLPRITFHENRISCNGLFRHGYLLAPVMAECIQDYLKGHENKFMSLFNKEQSNENHSQRAA